MAPSAKFVPTAYRPDQLEKEVLKLWHDEDTFHKSVEQRKQAGGDRWRFLEGPPTANGTPGVHHVLCRAYKDAMCRWKTMQGFVVERSAGWDCHGLPVETMVQKELGLEGPADVERFGVETFNRASAVYWTFTRRRYPLGKCGLLGGAARDRCPGSGLAGDPFPAGRHRAV